MKMRFKYLLGFAMFLTTIFLFRCKKLPADGIFNGTSRIRGIVMFRNVLTNTLDTASTAQLTLEENGQKASDYVLSLNNGTFDISTLSTGNYTFNITYYRAIPGSTKSILYQATPAFSLGSNQFIDRDTLILLPTITASPTLQIKVNDATGAIVSNAQVYLYTDTSTLSKNRRTGAGSVKNGVTNQFGLVVFDNLQTNLSYFGASYIVRGQDTVSNRTIDTQKPLNQTALSATSLNKDSITITTDAHYALNIIVIDQYGAYIPGANVCIYSDKSLLAKNRNTCLGSISGAITNSQGAVNFSNLQGLNYYVSSYKVVGNKDTITNITTDQNPTIVLKANSSNTTFIKLQ